MIALENGLFPPFKSVAHLAAASEPGSWSPGQPGSASPSRGADRWAAGSARPAPRSPRPSAAPPGPSAAGGPGCLQSRPPLPSFLRHPPTGPGPTASPPPRGRVPAPCPRPGFGPGASPRHPRAPPGGLLSARPNAQPRLGARAPPAFVEGVCSFACEWGSLVNPRASAGTRRREMGVAPSSGLMKWERSLSERPANNPPPRATNPRPKSYMD